MELYLERNKDVSFLILRDYVCCGEKSHPSTRPRFGKDTDSMLVQEQIEIVSDKLRSKLASLSNAVLQGIPHPKFGRVEDGEDDIGNDYDDESESGDSSDGNNSGIYYPYLWFYHRRRKIAEAIKYLEEIHQGHLNVFCGYIQDRMADEWAAVDNLISKREITAEHIRYTYTDSRFMIDTKTLQQMHPIEHKATNCDDLGAEVLSKVDPPLEDEFILCLPPTIIGFNMQKKEWDADLVQNLVTLDVDLIEDVVWNTDAFKFLVIEDRMKELVQAVVTNQIHAAESTDLIRGKGSGLTMLLHGVAEVAKKPLYRVTCGDIGTKAEEVEKYLETIFLLGKTWDCGILILTSNRVGIFDEAFKSRIQLNLRYQNLNRGQRLEIWRNFISRLERLADGDSRGGLRIDAENILSHIDNLAKPELNGREIRNAISTARQLARYRKQPLGYEHLQSVIAEAEKFDQYLKDLHEGFSADERQNDKGER
ncbi:hypothetical protein SLS64_010258 [Diaporthe eres]